MGHPVMLLLIVVLVMFVDMTVYTLWLPFSYQKRWYFRCVPLGGCAGFLTYRRDLRRWRREISTADRRGWGRLRR